MMFTLALSIYVLSIIVLLPRNARKALDNDQRCHRQGWDEIRHTKRSRCRTYHADGCWRDDTEVNTRDIGVGLWHSIWMPVTIVAKSVWWLLTNSNSLLLRFINRKASPQVAEKRKEQQIKELQANIRRLEQEKEEWERSYA